MASKRRLRRRECTRKIRHPTEEKAKDHAYHWMRKHGQKTSWYKCRWCKGWHVGRPNFRKRQMIRNLFKR